MSKNGFFTSGRLLSTFYAATSIGVILWLLVSPVYSREAPERCITTLPEQFESKSYLLNDVRSGLLLYVETDGRHIVGISPSGKILWIRDPFVEAQLEPYRVARPRIVRLAPKADCAARLRKGSKFEHYLIFVGFDSTQFGSLDAQTGNFIFEGQN